jgi:putative restriction endonuclease
LSLEDDHQILVASDESADGYEYFHQFRDQSLTTPSTADLTPAARFMEVHRKLFGFESIDSGDRLTFGGLQSGETTLVDGRRVHIDGAPDEALVVNCRVTDVGSQQVRCTHHRTLETRPVAGTDLPDPFFDDTSGPSFEDLSQQVQEIKETRTGVAQKWEWGRLFRRARVTSGLSYEELAAEVDIAGTSALQIERSEGVYEMFPDRGYEEHGFSYSAIVELQRVFSNIENVRAAYDCIIATGHSLTVKETRVWVEILMAGADVTRERVREEVQTYEELRRKNPTESIRRILDVHAEYESSYRRT